MLNMADRSISVGTHARENRVFVGVRLRPDSVARIDAAASALGVNRSEAIRRALVMGMKPLEAEAKRASAKRAVRRSDELST